MKNAIDCLSAEWNNNAVGLVSYGASVAARAVERLRLVSGKLQTADVRQQVVLSLIIGFENFSVFKPGDYNLPALNTMLDQVVDWSTALAPPMRHCQRRSLVPRRSLPIPASVP